MYRSSETSELTTIFNGLGHCDNYSFSVELESALANSTNKAATLQYKLESTTTIVFYSDFDRNTASGHTSHGIMVQEIGALVAY